MTRRRVTRLLAALATAAAALMLAACAPAAPVRQAPGTDATSTTSQFSPAPEPPIPIPTPAPPGFFPPLPLSILEGGERLPTVEEIMAKKGLSREEAVLEFGRLKLEMEARDRAEGRIRKTMGPETAGSIIGTARGPLQLPPDAYIELFVLIGECPSGGCGKPPEYILRRGDATIEIDSEGKVYVPGQGWVRQLPPEFESLNPQFQFLFQFLRETSAP